MSNKLIIIIVIEFFEQFLKKYFVLYIYNNLSIYYNIFINIFTID